MKCSEYEELIYDYLDNELEPQKTKQVKAHLSECSACSERLCEIQQVLATVRTELSSVKVSNDFSQNVMLEIEKQEAFKFWSYAVIGVLGSVALFLSVLTVFLYPLLQFATKYTIQFISLGFNIVSALLPNSVLIVVFSVFLLLIAMVMRGVMHMEERQI